MEQMPGVFLEAEQEIVERAVDARLDDTLYMLVSRLMKITNEITFACIPSLGANYYLGISNFLEKNTLTMGSDVYNIIKVLENKHHFIDLLE